LNVDYEFVEMHFHWGEVQNDEAIGGSEHSIDGHKYPLELHMVHRNIHDETVSEALEHENGLTVLGFKFQVVPDSQSYNPSMDTLAMIAQNFLTQSNTKFAINDFQKMRSGKKSHIEDVNVVNFLPVLMDEYFHYHGSLTTGGCEESVNWVVFKNPLAIRESHLLALQSLKNNLGDNIVNNFRQTQPVNDRPIYYHGIALIQSKVISRGSSVGLRSKALPMHEDYILTVPKCADDPNPAPMADMEEQRDAEYLWSLVGCNSSLSISVNLWHSFIFLFGNIFYQSIMRS